MSTSPAPRVYRVTGLHCAACARSVERGVGRVEGVGHCELDFTSALLRVEGAAREDAVLDRVRALGYAARPVKGGDGAEPPAREAEEEAAPGSLPRFLLRRRDARPALIGAILLLPGLVFHEILGWEAAWIELPALAALLIAGAPVVRSAWRGLSVNREFNIQALMTIAVVGALVIGAWVEAGMVVVLFSLGEALEGYASARARGAIRGLMTTAPATALRIRQAGPRDGGGRDDSSARASSRPGNAAASGNGGASGIVAFSDNGAGAPPRAGAADGGNGTGRHGAAGAAAGRGAHGDGGVTVPVEELRPGDVILVLPGERLPMDGRVVAGASTLDQAALTGESLPVDKAPGSEVLAGSVNGEGALEVEVTRPASETTLRRMIRMVEEAQSRRAPVQRFIDRFARLYTPGVVALAVIVAVVPPVFFGQPFLSPDPQTFGWFYRALALLVVACPCALVISVPASVVSAITNAARSGILVKGGAHIEELARVGVVAFDKTGTLTEGALSVVGIRSVGCTDGEGEDGEPCEPCDDLLALAAAVEARSEHPVGRAVTLAARDRLPHKRIPVVTDHRALTGRGITASFEGRPVTVGSHRHLDLRVPRHGEHRRHAEDDAREGRTPVLVELDGDFLGTITLSDVPRPTAEDAVRELRAMGVTTVLLSGDSAGAVRFLADHVGIEEVRGDLLPEDKVAAIRELQARVGPVAMVGDGINDAPALAAADIGIAVGGDLGGTDQARDAAAATLMQRDLRVLPRTLRLARETMRTVKANVAFAVGIKIVFLLLILAGMGTLWMAVLADVGATLLVTLWGMRLLRWEGGAIHGT